MQRYSSQTKTHDRVETSHEITETSGIRTTDNHTRGHHLIGGDSATQGHMTIREGDDSHVTPKRIKEHPQQRNPTADTFSEGGEARDDMPANSQDMQKDSSTVIGLGVAHPNSGQTTQIQSQISMLNSRQQPTVQGSLPDNMDKIFGMESTMNSGINSAVVSQMQSREDFNRREQADGQVSQSITEL
mmetsp:Transcript_27145/g.41305  ORF Transcript_27145/g.41305 Transcript_27145/m.41305 type:complete len:187 (-) Transcript_27145:3624-4184(-)